LDFLTRSSREFSGNSDVAVTQAAYIKPEDKDSKAAMEKFETALTATQIESPAD
jgi:hypothetical protein